MDYVKDFERDHDEGLARFRRRRRKYCYCGQWIKKVREGNIASMKYPSVTEILSPYADFSHVPADVLAAAAQKRIVRMPGCRPQDILCGEVYLSITN